MRTKYINGILLTEMLKIGEIDKSAMENFLKTKDEAINPSTAATDMIESKIFGRPLNKSERNKKIKLIQVTELLIDLKTKLNHPENALTKMLDEYFQLYLTKEISMGQFKLAFNFLNNLEKRIMAGDSLNNILAEHSQDSVFEIEEDKAFYRSVWPTLTDEQKIEVTKLIKQREADLGK